MSCSRGAVVRDAGGGKLFAANKRLSPPGNGPDLSKYAAPTQHMRATVLRRSTKLARQAGVGAARVTDELLLTTRVSDSIIRSAVCLQVNSSRARSRPASPI